MDMNTALNQENLDAAFLKAKEMVTNLYVLDARCFDILKDCAKKGHVPSMRLLGRLYQGYTLAETRIENFQEPERDIPQSVRYFEMALEAGDAEAGFRLGCLFLEGQYLEADPKKAASYFERAAGLQDGEDAFPMLSQVRLGMLYSAGCYERINEGEDDPRIRCILPFDLIKAGKYLEMAYLSGSVEAGIRLSELYLMTKDNHHAEQILRRLEAAGEEEASDRLQAMGAQGLLDAQGEILYEEDEENSCLE